MAPRKPSTTVDLKLRLKEPLRAMIEKAAKANGVSMNAEMVARLERSFESDRVAELWDKVDSVFTALKDAGYDVKMSKDGKQ